MLAISIYSAAPFYAAADCDHIAAPLVANGKSWIKTDQRIYGLDKQGKLVETRLNVKDVHVLEDHGFDYGGHFQISPDGNYIDYEGYGKGKGFSEYLYDIRKGDERSLPDKVMFSPFGAFSSDSKMMVGISRAALTIFNTENGKVNTVPIPMALQEERYDRFVDPRWSLDGKNVYFVFIRHPEPEYYKFILAAKSFQKIGGFYEKTSHQHHFTENAKEVELYKNPCMQWQCGGNPLLSAKGDVASVDSDGGVLNTSYRLHLKKKDGSTLAIEQGEYSNCSGISLRINAWLKDGNYLIYSLNTKPYVYGVEENKKALLFDVPVAFYGWHE